MVEFISETTLGDTTALCELMEHYGSDKGGKDNSWHNYTKVYFSLFNTRKQDTLSIFELGLGTNNPTIPSNMGITGKPGASLRAWKDFFPNSCIYGADIDKNILFTEDRIKTYYCDQTDSSTIHKMWNDMDIPQTFDIIVDDGLHEFTANVCFMEHSIHKLAKNGYFIIEDILKRNIDVYITQMNLWKLRFPHCTFKLVELENTRNNVDNIMMIIHKQ